MTSTNKPVEKINIGAITASVWRNDGKDAKPFYKTTFENRYRQDGEWKTSGSYGQFDLVNLAKAALLAHSTCLKLGRSEEQTEDGADEQRDADAA